MYVPLLRVFSESSQAAYGQVSICGALVSQYIQINLMECAQWIPLRSRVHPSPRMQFEDGALPAGPPAANVAGAAAAGAAGNAGQCSLVRCSRVATWGALTRNSIRRT